MYSLNEEGCKELIEEVNKAHFPRDQKKGREKII